MHQLLNSLVPSVDIDCDDVMLEITAGVGGQEAMIFTQELFEMYNSFANYRGWQSEVADYSHTDMGNFLSVFENRNNNFYFLFICLFKEDPTTEAISPPFWVFMFVVYFIV